MAHLGLVILLGSGEASLSSQKLYDWAMAQIEAPIKVSILETPAGFELNSAQVAGRIATLMQEHLNQHAPEVTVVPARRRGTLFSPDDPSTVAPLFRSNFIVLGPGSPTYAVRQLRESMAWHVLLARHYLGAVIVLASAGAIAAGTHALPVYEIYKAGHDLYWQPGLDFFGAYGLNLAIVPHWNNADGGPELDTSRCYMGQARFQQLRALLSSEVVVVGIDEQTALVVDGEASICRVIGQGGVTLVTQADERRFESGQTLSIAHLGQFQPPNPGHGLPPELWQQAVAEQAEAVEVQPHDPLVWSLVETREGLRARQDWASSDQLRQQIVDLGWRVDDTPLGPRLHRVQGGADTRP